MLMPIVAQKNTSLPAVLGGAAARGPAIACWLGQAGFLLRWGDVRLAIDPYLSDSLAVKYRGTRFPHRRMMPSPIAPRDVKPLDAVFCTHSHTDHMDPDTLAPLAAVNPACRFVVPRSVRETAGERGIPAERLITADAGESGTLSGGIGWHALASAHEELATDAAGQQRFLGYVIECGKLRIYHSGDCVPYPGLAAELRRRAVHVAILPVNGRGPERSAAGIPGNFTFDEAVELCRQAGIASLLVCHFGMFDFNTVDEAWLDERIAALAGPPQCVRPNVVAAYALQASQAAARGPQRSFNPEPTATAGDTNRDSIPRRAVAVGAGLNEETRSLSRLVPLAQEARPHRQTQETKP
jgi:L-ascorbate metabolism protein UlaG (beta-lactamase superfamily)